MSSQIPTTKVEPEPQLAIPPPAKLKDKVEQKHSAPPSPTLPDSPEAKVSSPTTPVSPGATVRPETPDPKSGRKNSRPFSESSHRSQEHADFTSLTNLRIMAVIIGAFIAAILFAVGHHLLLAHLEGRPTHRKSQYWWKNVSNVFGNIVAILLGFSASTSMVQVTWRILRKKAVKISTISDLFTLPSFRSIFFLLPSIIKSKRVIFPIAYAVLYQALVLVSSFAPNALTVTPNYNIQNNLMVTDGTSRWVFTRSTLWIVYGPALGIICLLAVLGLLCIRANGTSLDADFATFLLTTRNAQLDQAFKGLMDPQDIGDARLRHEHMGVFLLEHPTSTDRSDPEKVRPRRSSETHV